MNKRLIVVSILLLVSAMLFIVGCSKQDSSPTTAASSLSADKTASGGVSPVTPQGGNGNGPGSNGGNCPGTTLTEVVDGGGAATCFNDYSWTVTKNIANPLVQINAGDCQDVPVDISVTRTLSSGVRGSICVTNGGADAT